MKVEKALEHLKWKYNNHWNPNSKDIEAFNSIIKFKELQEQKNLTQNEPLAKFWIHQMILLSRTKLYDGARSIQVINEILSKSVYEWCLILKEEIPMMRFNRVGLDKYPLDDKDDLNVSKIQNRNKNIINEFETELTKELKYEISDENIIKFVQKEINKITNNDK
jgi:hypothetical protein